MKIAVGSDHCGFNLKMEMIPMLKEENEVMDFGCYSTDMADFPVISQKVCAAITSGEAERGIMFCSTGIGACIACNKVKGIRAGLCHDIYSAHQCVEHDNVQILCLGADIVGKYVVKDIIKAFLKAEFSTSEEFRKRVAMLDEMEKDA